MSKTSPTYEAVKKATGGAALRPLGAVVGKSKDQVRRDLLSEAISADALIAIARHWNYSPVRLLIECGRLAEAEVADAVAAFGLESVSERALLAELLRRTPREGEGDLEARRVLRAPLDDV